MGPVELARARSAERQALARRTAKAVTAAWKRVDRSNIAASWRALLPLATALLGAAQTTAAAGADAYLDRLAAEFDVDSPAAGQLRVEMLSGVASDGRELETLLYRPAVAALGAIGLGGTVAQGLTAGQFTADLITRTQVADAGRAADMTALAARHTMTGYVRVLSLPSCSRCVILAGRRYGWNAGFKRHPLCDCVHLPVPSASAADPLITQPRAYFNSLSTAEQDRVFTAAGAEFIRLGADMGQVVNARRGAAGLTPAGPRLTAAEAQAARGGRSVGRLQTTDVFGQDLFITSTGSAGFRASGTPRLMPESILRIADGDRDEAVRLLRRFGYLN